MSMVGFPLLLIPLAIYNIIVFLMPGVSLADPLIKLTLMSGTEWPVTLSDMLVALGIVLLLFEVIKGARPGAKYLTDHLLSLIVFGAAAAEFVLWPQFGTSTYFLLALLALVDFLSGIALRARRGMAPAASGQAAKAPTAAHEPQFEPVIPPLTPAPAPVAPSVPVEPAQPKVAHADVAPNAPSPEVPSPELQPGNSSPSAPDEPRR
ncbi:MAG TPA: hypothetical protein VF957_18635 [Bradyrhizobium sp.]